MIDLAARIKKIRSTGYWQVTIRPTQFEKRLGTLSDCWDVVESTAVAFRGWDYPHVDHEEREVGDKWVQSGLDWEYGHIEAWRFYQSGQFIHHFACVEDYHSLSWQSSEGTPTRYLLWVHTLYLLTEILEFAGRLGAKSILSPAAFIEIKLGNMDRRELTHERFSDRLRQRYVCQRETITWQETLSVQALMAGSADSAIDAAIHVFENFGWRSPPRDLLAERQRVLLEKRLRDNRV